MNKTMQSFPDYKNYDSFHLFLDSADFYIAALKYYKDILSSDFKNMTQDEELAIILDDESIQNSKAHKELTRLNALYDGLKSDRENASVNSLGITFSISHGSVRLLKSVGLLYLEHLKSRRGKFTEKGNVSLHVIEMLDTRLAKLAEKTEMGAFGAAEKVELLVGDLGFIRSEESTKTEDNSRPFRKTIIPIVIKSDEILDEDLRSRCLDLFEAFRVDGNHERLDTVVTEATRILEDRLRKISGLPSKVIGLDLSQKAFGIPNPILRVSENDSEQEAVHLLFRGVFGFIRNSVHHKLVSELRPERVIQILGTVDYLLSIIEGSQKVEIK